MNIADLPDPRLRERILVTASGCWEWTGARTAAGYGRISWKGHVERVHRVVAHLVHGLDFTDGRVVCHHCDNPPCANPAHLFIGVLKDNTQDMLAKGRCRSGAKRQVQCQRGHPLAGENLKIGSNGQRICRTCANASQRRYYHRRMENDPEFRARPHRNVAAREIRSLAHRLGVSVDG